MITKEMIDALRMCGDWVLILKEEAFDGARKIGNIYVPDTVNTNIRESKIGRVLRCGRGTVDNNGRFRACGIIENNLVYYTRYGKETVEGVDGEQYVITRNRGVLAYVLVAKNNILGVVPRHNRLLVEEIKVGEHTTSSGIVLLDAKPKVDDYRRWRVLDVGPGEPKKHKKYFEYADPIKPVVSVGDIVWAAQQSGVQVSWYSGTKKMVRRLIPESECILYEKLGS